jgi:SPP1 gp7 family putative phage head morphogenesis protein
MADEPQSYWDKRAARVMDSIHEGNADTLTEIGRAYQKAAKRIKGEAEKIIYNYQNRYGLSGKETADYLTAPATYEEYKEIEARLLPALLKLKGPALEAFIEDHNEELAFASSRSAVWRIDRQRALHFSLEAEMLALAASQEGATAERLSRIFPEALDRTSYDIQKGLGLFISYAHPSTQYLEQILREPWNGANYSERIWDGADKLQRALNGVVTKGLLTGQSIAQMAQEIENRMHAGYNNAVRLVRTETTYIANQAILAAYKAHGVEKYLYVAILDKLTSEVCRDLDGQVFRVDEARVGVNLPPMHPNCRSTTSGVTDPEALAKAERLARDPQTGETEHVPGSMTYRQWQDMLEARRRAKANPEPKPAPIGKPSRATALMASMAIADESLGGADSLFSLRLAHEARLINTDAGHAYSLDDGAEYELAKGQRVFDVEILSGGEDDNPIGEDTLNWLVKAYGGEASKWRSAKGKAWIKTGGGLVLAELGWYQEPTVGRREFIIIRLLD